MHGRVATTRAVVTGLLAATLLALVGCRASSATRDALRTAGDQLTSLDLAPLGDVVGRGSYGSAGVSGSRPTAFVALRAAAPAPSLLADVGARLRRAGYAPFVACRPPGPCTWRRSEGATLLTADAVVLGPGRPWGERSTAHGTVAPGQQVLQVSVTVGG